MKFSITIPAYKKQFLKEAIGSVLNQTYQDYELIIVDDCSPQDLKSVVDSFSDTRIRYYRNATNCGAENLVDNWNICLGYCLGEWVICMGDDDILLPSCLEEYAVAISAHPEFDAFHVRTKLIDEQGNFIKLCPDRPEFTSAYGNIIQSLEGREQYMGDFCYRTERLRSEGGYYKLPYAWAADGVISFIMGCPNGVYNIQKPTFCFRMSNCSISGSGNYEKKLEAILQTAQWLTDFVSKQKPESEFEKEELQSLERLIPQFASRFRFSHILDSITQHKYKVFYWIANRKKYGVSIGMVLRAAVLSFAYHPKK